MSFAARVPVRGRCVTLASLVGVLLAWACSGALATAADAGGVSFTYLDPAFSQSLYGIGLSGQFFGGVAFAPSGDPLVDFCEPGGGSLDRFDHANLLPETEGTTTLHPLSTEASGAGCGLTNHPDGALYSNTSSGVIELDANTGAVLAGPFGAGGNVLGITVDPLTRNLIYVRSDGTLGIVDPSLSTESTFSTATSGDFIDQIDFDPTGQYLFISDRTHDALTIVRRDGSVLQTVPLAEGRGEPDGIAFHSAPPQFVVTNDTDGTLSRFEFPGNDYSAPPIQSLLASGGFRGDNLNVGTDTCMYLSQEGTRYDNGVEASENSLVRVCPGFQPPSLGLLPYNISLPTISGGASVGQTLTCNPGSWGGDGPQTYTYRWRRGGSAITGASSTATYVVSFADAGHGLECEVSSSNEVGSATARSAQVRVPGQPVQQVVFVHGIRADCQEIGGSGQSYAGLYNGLQIDELPIYTFCYDHDNAFGGPGSHGGKHAPLNSARCFSDSSLGGAVYRNAVSSFVDTRVQETARPGWNGPLAVTAGAADRNDGDSALAYDAAKLDDCISQLVQWDIQTFGHPLPIAVVGNSMGGAITRGWLQLAKQRATAGLSSSLGGVSTVVFLQGAVEGSWLAKVGSGVDTGLNIGPDPLGLAHDIDSWARDLASKNDLDPTRPGVKDLVPGSGWYGSIVAAGSPPALHYYTISTNIHLNFYWEVLWWTSPGPSTDFLGDGLMQLGNPASNALPKWGGSEFSPVGNAPDQQQWAIEVNLTAPLNVNGILAILGAVLHQPYAHFNFGDQIAHLQVGSCGPGHGLIAIPQELARIFNGPDDACTSPAGAASVRANRGARPVAIRRTRVRGHLGRARAAVLGQPGEFAAVDHTDRATLTILRDSRRGGRPFELSLPSDPGITGTLSARSLRGKRVRFHGRATEAGRSVSLRLDGTIDRSHHAVRLAINVGRSNYRFITATPGTKAARATDRRILSALKANSIATLVALLPPQLLAGRSRAEVVAGLRAQGIHITALRVSGAGKVIWLANGAPAFSQPIVVSARTPHGRSTKHATLTLIENGGRWKLLGAR
jgi:hypothetical protein